MNYKLLCLETVTAKELKDQKKLKLMRSIL